MLDHTGGVRADCIPQLAVPVKAMNFTAQLVARFNIALFSPPDIITSKRGIQPGTLQERQRFAGNKSELRIETKRAIVVARLYETDPYGFLRRCPIERGIHQASPDGAILHSRSDRDRTDPKYRRTLVHEVTTDDLPSLFRDYAVESRGADQHRRETGCGFGRGKVWWKVVSFREVSERVIQDTAAHLRIRFTSVANVHSRSPVLQRAYDCHAAADYSLQGTPSHTLKDPVWPPAVDVEPSGPGSLRPSADELPWCCATSNAVAIPRPS